MPKPEPASPEITDAQPPLIPTPRRVRFEGQWARGGQGIDGAFDSSLPANAYRVAIDSAGVRTVRWGEHAHQAGMATLGQLGTWGARAKGEGWLPVIEVEDQGAFTTRGLMLDISRDKVPTPLALRHLPLLLLTLKLNHFQLYTEHTFAYERHQAVWRDASPITPDEIRDYARSLDRLYGVGLAPNQNCFGHLSRWLKLPEYAHLAETHGAWKFLDFDRSGPFSLCPIDERSEAFVADLLGQLCPLFKSPYVNIGCDETFDVGFGRSAAEVDRRAAAEGSPEAGRASLYFEFVNKIAAIARRLGKRPMLWADIALSHPQMLDRWPRDLATGDAAIGLAWGYEPDAPFASWCELLAKNNIPAWVCPGTSTWRSFTGRTTERRANLRAACAAMRSPNPPEGFLLTDWGDCGHMQHWVFTELALAEGAQAAWRGELPPDDDRAAWSQLHGAIDMHVFNAPGSGLASWLSELGDLDLPLRRAAGVRNQSTLFVDLFPHTTPRRIDLPRSAFESVRESLNVLRGRLNRAAVDERRLEEIDHTLAMLDLAIEHAIATRPTDGSITRIAPSAANRSRLRLMATAVEAEHRRLWVKRNRPGGLDDSCSHLQKVIASLNEP